MVDWTGDVSRPAEPDDGDSDMSSLLDGGDEEEQTTTDAAETEEPSAEPETEGSPSQPDEDAGGDGDMASDEGETQDEAGTDDDDTDDSSEVTDDIAAIAEEATGDSESETSIETTEDTQSDTKLASTDGGAVSGGLVSESMLADHAPDAVARADAVDQDPRWTLLVWGDEGTGKSHFAHTAPAPVMYLDTEGKASNLAEKFDQEIVYFDAGDYDRARSSLVQALDVLETVKNDHGIVGTIVVDSMSKLWEFAQQKHVDEHYVTKETPADVEFKSGLQGGTDWKQIKRYHNDRFRDVLAECPFHVVMTAMAEEDYNAVMEGSSGTPMKPQGEKNNRYAVENIIRLRNRSDGETVGDLLKTDRTRLRFTGLEWPEFGDVTEFVTEIAEAEQTPGDVDVDDWPVNVVRGRPSVDANPEETDE